jgi:acyl-CoA synthetase (AMP-forming)/AMP-acid ligase II
VPTEHSLLQWLTEPTSERGIRFALPRDGWEFYSYEKLAECTRRAATRFHDEGVAAGDVVALMYPNSADFVAAFFGCLTLGATPAPLAPPAMLGDRDGHARSLVAMLRAGDIQVIATTGRLAPTVAAMTADAGTRVVAHHAQDDVVQWNRELVVPETALVQFSSGSTGVPRGVRVPLTALEANLRIVTGWMRGSVERDAMASWVPAYHDMGLIGCLLAPVSRGADIWLMEPAQFVRAPGRWLRCFDRSQATMGAAPSFGLKHIVRHVRRDTIDELDLSGWRALVVGAERVDATTLGEFARFLAPAGFSAAALMPAYGLAEATLAVSGSPPGEHPTTLTFDPSSLVPGRRVRLADPNGPGLTLVGCGRALPGVGVAIIGGDDAELADGCLGEIEVSGECVAAGYVNSGDPLNGVLRTGDAGFLYNDELFVLGRIGDCVKVRGRWLFADDIEELVRSLAQPLLRHCVLVGPLNGRETVVIVMEGGRDVRAAEIGTAVSAHADGPRVLVMSARRGSIMRTTSGKPRRRLMWEAFVVGDLTGTVVWDSDDISLPSKVVQEQYPTRA